MAGEHLEIYTFPYLIQRALAQVPDTQDKREGSIIYDALAPACYELAKMYESMRTLYLDTYALTAAGEYLDYRAAEQGLARFEASYALRRADFTQTDGEAMAVPIGSRFSTIDATSPVNFVVVAPYAADGAPVAGAYILRAESAGAAGNNYVGSLVPITYLNGLAAATMGAIVQPAQDKETDEELRTRYLLAVTNKPFGGNIAQYDQEMKEIEGVGEVQVYPVWDGGGTVKLSVVDSQYNAISPDFIDTLQNMVDPENGNGETGVGIGMAPIGHKVTVVTPTELAIDVETTVTLLPEYTVGQVEDAIKEEIDAYLLLLRTSWGIADQYNNYSLGIYLAQVNAAILRVAGVANVTNTTLNGAAADITLQEDATLQQLPILGAVVINGG